MSRGIRWFGLFCLLGLAGCGTDTHEILINKAMTQLEDASSKVKTITDELNKAKKEAGDDKNKYKTSKEVIKSIQNAEEAADALKKVGSKLSEVNQNINLAKDSFTPAQQEANVKTYRSKIQGMVESLSVGKSELQTLIREIDKSSKEAHEAIERLQKKLLEADGQFESLSRPR